MSPNYYYSARGQCSLPEIVTRHNASLIIEGGLSWNITRVTAREQSSIIFSQPDTIPMTKVIIAQGQAELEFRGIFEATLGRPGTFIPNLPDIVSQRFVLSGLRKSVCHISLSHCIN